MPLTFNRNFQSLLVTVPGATRPHREHSAFFNSQDSLSHRSQRPVAPGEQHDDRRARRQPEDRPAAGHHPGGRRARDRQRHDQQLRRGVRPLGRRDHQRHAQVGHQPPTRAAAFFFGNTEATNAGDYFTHTEGADQVRQQRLHARRPDRPQQAVLLRRLPAHDRQLRLRRPRHRADAGDAQRRLQRGVAAHLRSADRRRQRQQPRAVRQQP